MKSLNNSFNNLNTGNVPETKKDILFILGSGASVDSGLPTYRGPNGIYKDEDYPEKYFQNINFNNILNIWNVPEIEKVWDFFRDLYITSFNKDLGPTYKEIENIITKYPNSCIITQNIDGLALKLNCNIPIIEIHGNNRNMMCMNKKCKKINKINIDNPYCECKSYCRPDIVCYGEELDSKKVEQCCKETKKFYKYVVIIGTTLQFDYLKRFIQNAKRRFAKVIHINPDKNYVENVGKNEIWIKDNALEGLKYFQNKY